jgi:PIN domain nuclease of toxin-antitoxin system
MRLLLDTHTLLWWWLDDPRLSRRASEAIAAEDSEVHVSAASAWEIATKVRIGRLERATDLSERFEAEVAREGFHPIPITVAHARQAGALEGEHRDPFDRILAAQSMMEDLELVSMDRRIGKLGARLIW